MPPIAVYTIREELRDFLVSDHHALCFEWRHKKIAQTNLRD